METDALITYKIFVVDMEFVLLGSLAALGFHFSKNEHLLNSREIINVPWNKF